MRRVPDVLDVWFDSGSMSFAQVHYPFENEDWFEHHFPGDFIVEYIGQTRGWFYTMHVLAGAIFDRPAFSTCLSHGIVLGSDGNKMSKSLRNYPSVYEVFDRDGADAMRWFLMSSPILRGGNLIVTEQGIRDSVRQVLIPLWNSWYFFALYANAAGYDAQRSTGSEDPLDGYLLAKLRQYVEAMTGQLDDYEVANACDSTRAFLDVLTNWYIRRSRERFWATDGAVDVGAFDTLHTVLETVTRVAAPLLPLTTEEIWRGLTGERSVHLTDWPDPEVLPQDDALVTAMDLVRDVCSTGSSLRKAAGLRNRLPLSTLTVVVDGASALDRFTSLVADELNIKSVRLLDAAAPEAASYGVAQRLTVNARAAGPRLGRDVQTAIKGSKSGDWSVADDGTVTAGGLELVEGEYTLETVAGSADEASTIGMLPRGGFVVLDTSITPELAAEGLARDLVRAVQQARREADLDVSDRISLSITGSDAVLDAARTHEELIARETLATSYELGAMADGSHDVRTEVSRRRRGAGDGGGQPGREPQASREPVERGQHLVGRLVGHAPDQLGCSCLGPRREVGGVRLERDEDTDLRGALPPGLGPGLLQGGDLGADAPLRGRGHPAVGVLGDPPERLRPAAGADDDRHVGPGGLGPRPRRAEGDELALVGRFLLRPQRAHRFDVLAQDGAPPVGGNVVIGELVGVPAEAGADADPAGGEVVERGDRLRERDRVGLDRQRRPRWTTRSASVTAATVASETHGSRVRR